MLGPYHLASLFLTQARVSGTVCQWQSSSMRVSCPSRRSTPGNGIDETVAWEFQRDTPSFRTSEVSGLRHRHVIEEKLKFSAFAPSVLPKPWQLWSPANQAWIFPAQLCFALAWAFEQYARASGTTSYRT